jgi:osmoprotectant transport system permease protein
MFDDIATIAGSPTAQRAWVHTVWVARAVVLATAFALPAGVLVSRSTRCNRAARWTCDILSRVPALALLGACAAFLGGRGATLPFLLLCTLPPLIRGVLDGCRAVDRNLAELAVASGLPAATRLRFVVGPMALPKIVSGLGEAVIYSSAATTLAAVAGAGGLGEIIVEGLAAGDPRRMLTGAVLATVLTVLLRGLFMALPWLVTPLWGAGKLEGGLAQPPKARASR